MMGDCTGIGMTLMMLAFWIGPIALVVWVAGGLRRSRGASHRDLAPLDILRRRYASGELSRTEFEQAMGDLP